MSDRSSIKPHYSLEGATQFRDISGRRTNAAWDWCTLRMCVYHNVMDYVHLRHHRNKGQKGLSWYLYTCRVGFESYRGHLALDEPSPQTPKARIAESAWY